MAANDNTPGKQRVPATGKCPICGMTLVPLESGEHNHTDGKPVVAIEPGTIQTMGVRTEEVRQENGNLSVSSAAILRSSTGSHVIVALGEGRFQGRDVTTGKVADGQTRILSGLEEGERVVTRAQFMIDAESNLQETLDKFEESGGGHAGH